VINHYDFLLIVIRHEELKKQSRSVTCGNFWASWKLSFWARWKLSGHGNFRHERGFSTGNSAPNLAIKPSSIHLLIAIYITIEAGGGGTAPPRPCPCCKQFPAVPLSLRPEIWLPNCDLHHHRSRRRRNCSSASLSLLQAIPGCSVVSPA
jgi:hypothetical protein